MRAPVVYQVYPRSFQDSDGDGVGDLRGIERRLDHIAWLGADALWLSPIYPSPLADMGYDVADFTGVGPEYGTLHQFDALVEAAHARGLKLLMDLVPCHTSIEHPWFREHPDWYIWSGREGPLNNWRATFGGPAWSPDPYARERGWYLHSFYPEQPDLDWRNPEVVEAMQAVLRFWLDRGVDGFRIDAIDRLVKDAQMRDDPPATQPFALPLGEDFGRLDHVHSTNSPDIRQALGAIREAAGDSLLVGEVYLPAADVAPYLEHLDMAFAFELFHSAWERDQLAAAVAGASKLERKGASATAWVLSNHDFPRLATRFGEQNTRAAAVLLLTLPGAAFVYQGEEIGMADGPGADPPIDRAGRDGARHPMQWDPAGGFSEGWPWLPLVDPAERNVADQSRDPGSLLSLYRELIALRPRLGDGIELIEPAPTGVLAYRRGDHVVVINLTAEERDSPAHAEVVLATHPSGDGRLAPHAAIVALEKN
ncbi:MAG: alpha-glucosidase [Thermoleophilaceae bacterium]|jgi:alpha-glucosidase|nr:alpha-glucosidase [Thermoleophilaceae bacterium]